MSIYEHGINFWDDERQQYVSSRKVNKPLGANAPHYPNKAERVLLTQMMQKSGQTEEQVRSVKNNRVKLAEAQKSMSLSCSAKRLARQLYEQKKNRRNNAARLGIEVWQLK